MFFCGLWWFGVFVVKGQITFQKLYNADTTTHFNDVVQTADGGYLACGKTALNDNLLFKTNSQGVPQWSKKLGDSTRSEEACQVGLFNNGSGYFYLSFIDSAVSTVQSINLAKTDLNGNLIWNKQFRATPGDFLSNPAIRELQNGGFIISANYLEQASNSNYFLFIKTDANGNLIWSNRFAEGIGLVKPKCYDVEESLDQSRYVTVGFSTFGGNYGMYSVCVDTNGNLLWVNKHNDIAINVNYGFSLTRTSDGNFVVAGNLNTLSPLLKKIDMNGNLIWAYKYILQNNGATIGAMSVKQTTDGGFVFSGYRVNTPNKKPILFKVNGAGTFLWARMYNMGYDYYTLGSIYPKLPVKRTSDKGFILANNSHDTITYTKSSGWLIKTDSLGDSGCEDSLVLCTTLVLALNNSSAVINAAGIPQWTVSYTATSLVPTTSLSCINIIEGVDEVVSENEISVFPNPSTGKFKIKNEQLISRAEVYDLQGQLIFSEAILPEKSEFIEIDISKFANGMYILKVVGEKEFYSRIGKKD